MSAMLQYRRTRRQTVRMWLFWTAGFLAFPLAGATGTAVAGRVDSPWAALARWGARLDRHHPGRH
jgi:hypothetical protein